MAHTPAPWNLEWVIDGAFQVSGTLEGDKCVVAARQACPARHAEFLANAHLIAAAPDLLAALKALTQDSRFNLVIGGNPNAVDALVKQVDQAIAKAEAR